MIKNEWKRLLQNPLLILVLFVIILIPAIYSGFFLASMWNPYGELSKMPVAVVNLDQPVKYNGKQLHVGDDFVENLKEDQSLDFHFVDETIAEDGLKEGVYYCVITIPEDFSHSASTVLEDEPEQMKLSYKTNPATNYVAMKLSESALNKMETSLQEKVVQTYSESMFDSLDDIADNLQDASKGAKKIYNGEKTVNDGVVALADGSGELKDGSAKLKNGAGTLKKGTSQLKSGSKTLKKGTKDLKKGTSDLKKGVKKYTKGANSINTGASELNKGIDTLANSLKDQDLAGSVTALATGAKQLDTAVKNNPVSLTDEQKQQISTTGGAGASAYADSFATGVCTSISGSIKQSKSTISNAAGSQASASVASDENVAKALKQIESQLKPAIGEENATAMTNSIKQLVVQTATATAQTTAGNVTEQIADSVASDNSKSSVSSALSGNLDTLGSGIASKTADSVVASVNTGLKTTLGSYTGQISGGLDQLNSAMPTLMSGVNQLQKGSSTLASGTKTLVSNNKTLNSGAAKLDTGAAKLNTGAGDLKNGASKLDKGAGDLKNGVAALNDGVSKLNSGCGELKNGMPKLLDGTSELYDGLKDGVKEINDTNTDTTNAEMFANPVVTNETKLTKVDDNGHAMAAYMMSVGLWVACLAFCLMYPLTKKDTLTNGFAWWASKASILYPMALLQGVLIVAILHVTLGFSPVRMSETIFYSCLASLAFMSLMYFFNVLLGKVGSFLMLVFMVFQLAGSAGTYPIEISGPLANGLHKYMPFTYTVNAFRSTIGGGLSTPTSTAVLIGIFVVFTVLTILLFSIRAKKEKEGKGNLYEWLENAGMA